MQRPLLQSKLKLLLLRLDHFVFGLESLKQLEYVVTVSNNVL